jgi:DNA-binding winged helix-turn-helix (wHTH) protein
MHNVHELYFGPFRIDLRDERLWQGTQVLRLRPKSFAVLRYLLERPGRLVTKDELLHALWSETVVQEETVTACLRDLRRVLDDDPRRPQYIETVHRRGYRFIAPVLETGASTGHAEGSPVVVSGPQSVSRSPIGLVGRETELGRLHAWLAQAMRGQRRVVFVTGEAGSGKTTLVDVFLGQAAALEGVWLVRGECLEHYGAGEAYLPVLAALGRLCRGQRG